MNIVISRLKKNMKNWKWWVALPYMLTFTFLVGGLYVIGVSLEFVGKKIQVPFIGDYNTLFARQVLNFIKNGRKK